MSEFKRFGYDCNNGLNCFNVKHRLDFRHFFDCLPGKISMTDIDATVEVCGHFLFMEMKRGQDELPFGQALYFKNLTLLSDKIAVLIVHGDSETMQCYALRHVWKGIIYPWVNASLDEVKDIISQWADLAMKPIKIAA
jgi:hypothetical protein